MRTRSSKRSFTMAQIASAAGVSITTISKVLNQHPDVAQETRERIEQLLIEHGYTLKNKAAHALKKGRGGLINFVVPELFEDYSTSIMKGVEDVLQPLGMHLSVCSTREETQREGQWLQTSSDGVILVLVENEPTLQELRHHGIPFVVIDRKGDLDLDIPSVGATNWLGGRTATEHLISLGHRRIAFVQGRPYPSTRDRLAGYRSALEEAGIPVDPELLRPGTFSAAQSYSETHYLLELPDPPTAIFTCNDGQALGVYRALYERRILVPDEMSVIGFDDASYAGELAPPLTTMRQPLFEMGRVAAGMLIRLITGEPIDSIRVELATPLIKRASSAPPRQKPLSK